MPRNRDLFDDSTMTFGEHLEVLRVHLFRALIGMAVGVVIALFFGDRIIGTLRDPIDNALRRANMPEVKDDLGGMDFTGFLEWLFSDEEPPPKKPPVLEDALAADELLVQVPLADVKAMIEAVAPGTVKADPPATVEKPADSKTPKSDTVNEPVVTTVPLILKSPDIALFKQTADRFNHPVTFKVEEAFATYIKISVVAGIVLASPWIFYQVWLFVAAGLYGHERKYVYVYLPMSLGLFVVGGLFCFYFVFPIVLDFLIGFNKWLGVELQPRLSEYISLVLLLPVMFGISFQLPLIMLFIERIGIITVHGYIENWRMAVLVISIASMLLTPSDPTSMLLMMFPLIILYFGGILLCRFRPGAAADPLA